jgi:spore coat protein U-like protein
LRPTPLGLALVLALLAAPGLAQVTCTYAVDPAIDFGTLIGVPTPQIDVMATISVTCSALASVNHRVCLSLPPGSGDLSIADRRMVLGGHSVQYQLYADSGRTQVWGELGAGSPPVAVDFPLLVGQRTEVRTVYGRVFAGQDGQAVGTYLSSLAPVARRQDYLVLPPDCQTVMGNTATLASLSARLAIEPNCTITANPLSFGTVTGLTGHAATSNLSVTCTVDAAYSIALDGGSITADVGDRRMRLGPGPDTVAYQLYRDAAHTSIWGDTAGITVSDTGTGNPESIPIYGFVPAQGPKPQGTYEDTVTATVTY